MSFQVFTSNHLVLGRSYVIVTSRTLHSGWATAEVFLLSPENSQPYRSMAFYFEGSGYPIEESLRPKLDVPAAALEWALEQLEADLREWHKHQPPGTPLPHQVTLQEADHSVMSRVWMRGRCREAIQTIQAQTKDRELREFVAAHTWLPNLVERPFR